MEKSDTRRHMIIPDPQIKAGQKTDHIDWAAEAVIEYLPDVIIIVGDWWDLSSLSRHEAIGSIHMEGTRLNDDINAGNEAFERFNARIDKEIKRRQRRHILRWNPDKEILLGNHDIRLQKLIDSMPQLAGVLSMDMLKTPGFRRHPFLKILEVDGIKYCHYFPNPFTGKAIGGTIINRLNHIGSSFVQGHQQGLLYASKQFPDHIKHGLVCGRFYVEHEHYRSEDVQNSEWSGIVVLNEVRNGNYDLMPLSMRYLKAKYGRV